MAKKHGIFIYEEGTAVTVPLVSSAGLQVVVGTAPVNMVDDPSSVVNTPILANSAAEAMAALGYSADFKKYTLCATMYATANLYQVSPVVYINVLDPAKHKKAMDERAVAVEDLQAVVEQVGVLRDSVAVTYEVEETHTTGGIVTYDAVPDSDVSENPAEAGYYEKDGDEYKATEDATPDEDKTYYVRNESGVTKETVTVTKTAEKGVDYTLDFDSDGYLVVTLISGREIASVASVKVSGNQLDPDAVTKSDVIGSVDVSTGKETGMEVIRQVYPKLNLVPGILLAPYWSQIPEVGIALSAKAANINGVFEAMAFVDVPTDGEGGARKYADVKAVKEECGFTSEFCVPCWPQVRIGEIVMPYSAVAAARTAYYDAANEDVPSRSPSNILLAITGTCLEDGTEVTLDQDQATTVGEYGVMTATNINGFKMWGNHTGAWPGSGDAKDIWISVRRMFNWQGNTFILTYSDKVDDPMNYKLIEDIVDSENIRCAAYAPEHWAGASIEYLESDNPVTDVLAGRMTFRQHIAPYTPAETINNILNYDTGMLQAALLGGE